MSFFSRPSSPFAPPSLGASELLAAALLREERYRLTPLRRLAGETRGTTAALDSLVTPVGSLRDAGRALARTNGVVFSVSSSASTVASGIAGDGATTGSIDLSITSLARGATFSFNGVATPFTSAEATVVQKIDDSLPAKARTVTFTLGSDAEQETVAIEVSSSTTIEQFVETFNGASALGSAELINVGTEPNPDFTVVIRANEVGLTRGSLAIEVGEALLDPNTDGDPSDAPFGKAVTIEAANARFAIAGIAGTFERESNTVSDAVTGLTLILGGTGDTTLTVGADASAGAERLRSFVSAFNQLTGFIDARNGFTRTTGGGGVGFAAGPLRDTTVDDLLRESLRSDLRGLSSVGSGALSLPELGVTTNRDGTVSFDEAVARRAFAATPKEATATLKALGARIEGTIAAFDGSTGLIAVARRRSEAQLDRYETTINAIETRLGNTIAGLTKRYAQMEGALARLSVQGDLLRTLFPSP